MDRWSFLKKDFIEMLIEFHQRGKLNRAINATFITLIPKVFNLVELRDYRPISLVGCVYKLFSKMLANRLKHVILSVLSPY